MNPNEKNHDLELEVLNAMNQQCQCNIERDAITSSQLMCLSPNVLGFIFIISGTSEIGTSEMLGYFESWLTSVSTMVIVQSQLLDVISGNCNVSKSEPGPGPAPIQGQMATVQVSFKVIVILPLTVVMTASLFFILAVIAEMCIKFCVMGKTTPQHPQRPQRPQCPQRPTRDTQQEVVPPILETVQKPFPVQLPQSLPKLQMDPPIPEIAPFGSLPAQHDGLPQLDY